MTEIRHIAEGFLIMVICIVVGVIMSFVMGSTIDQMVEGFDASGAFDVSEGWQSDAQQNTIINIAYLWYMIIPIIGVVIFISSIVHAYVFRREDGYETMGRL